MEGLEDLALSIVCSFAFQVGPYIYEIAHSLLTAALRDFEIYRLLSFYLTHCNQSNFYTGG